ncbi:MAG: hypothetical protein JKY65_00390, partial [Planctomycetes bacterium]|nr:hypothetical protein [Planctomycetota bacterium]
MDRDTRQLARAGDIGPEDRLDLARRHLRSGEPSEALALIETVFESSRLGPEPIAEAGVLACRARADLGQWRAAARAAIWTRRVASDALPEELLTETRAALSTPSPVAEGAETEAAERERLWLSSWLGGSADVLIEGSDEQDWRRLALVVGHEDLALDYLDHADPLVRARAHQGLALREGAAALEQ